MKLIYVASPFAGDTEKNTEFAKLACRHVMDEGHAFFAPHLLYPQLLDDENQKERKLALDMGLTMLAKCDELWAFGDIISPGMKEEIDYARQMCIPRRIVTTEQIKGIQVSDYAIWTSIRVDTPLEGKSGFLCENNKIIIFSSKKEAEIRIKDIRNLYLNNAPATEYLCAAHLPEYSSRHRIHLEDLRELDMYPIFNPEKFEVENQVYGNTGGNCMVGTVRFYLPDINKSVWVNCNKECALITSADIIWNEDGSESWERPEQVNLYTVFFEQEIPQAAASWLPMIHKTLEYTIEQETKCFPGNSFMLPVSWLPESIKENVNPEYLEWLCAEGKKARIVHGGNIETETWYQQKNHSTFEMSVPN